MIDQAYQELDALQIKDGKKMDFTAPQVLLSQSLAKELGKQPGDSLEVGEQTYSITGVFQEQSSVPPVLFQPYCMRQVCTRRTVFRQ